MTSRPDDAESLRRAKEALKDAYGGRSWFRGVGIAPLGSGLALRLNVDPTANLSADEIPKMFRGYKVDVVYIRAYEPRRQGAKN